MVCFLLLCLLITFLSLNLFHCLDKCRKSLVEENGVSIIYRMLNQSISESTLLRIAALFHNLSFDGEWKFTFFSFIKL